MQTFAEFLAEAARKREAVNTLFEERLFELVGILHRISSALDAEHIAHEVIGGLAVLIHVEEADPEHATLTRDVDLMVRREDLERAAAIVERVGLADRIRLLSSQSSAGNPRKAILGCSVNVAPIPELLRMKLSAFRAKDRVHVRSMDAAGLITPGVESTLPAELRQRLAHVRETD